MTRQSDLPARAPRCSVLLASLHAVEQLESRTLLSALIGTAIDEVAELPPNFVHEFDRATGQERIVDPSSYSTDSDLAVLNASLRANGYEGLNDLLDSLGSPEEFMANLNGAPAGSGAANASISDTPDTGDRSVFGPDSRTQVTGTTTFPWRAIGRVHTGGSGAMISPFHVLTAGHVVHSGGSGGVWYNDLQVDLGQASQYDRPYGEADWTYVRSYTGWTQNADWSWDWAVITLDRNIGNYTGWFGREWHSSTGYYDGLTVNTAGYPGDQPFGTMWFASGPVGYGTSTHFYYNGTMDTAGGQSGSPVWRYDGTNRYILGVHAYGDGGDGYNKAVRQTEGKFNNTGDWVAADTAPTDRPDLVDYDDWYNTNYAYFTPDPVTHGQQMTLRSVVRNNGTAAAGSFNVAFYASTNSIISTGDYLLGSVNIGSLGAFAWADAIATVNVSPSIPAGSYYVGWIIDSGGSQTEYLESNNTAYISGNLLLINAISADAYEANDTQATAYNLGRLGVRNIYNLNVHASNNNDYYSFTADATGTMTASIDFLHANGDLDFQLLNSAGTVVAGSYTTTDDESFNYVVTKNQTYTLRVYGYAGAVNMNYSLSVNSPVAPPKVTAATYYVQTGPWIYLDIDEHLNNTVDPADVSIVNLTTATVVNPASYTVAAYPSGSLTYVDIHFLTVPADGNYELRLTAAGITDQLGLALDGDNNGTAGGNYAFRFFHLAGDANLDRIVDITDLGLLATNWQASGTVPWSMGNFNFDNKVDITDLGMLATNWQFYLAPLAPEPGAATSALPPSQRWDVLQFSDGKLERAWTPKFRRNLDEVSELLESMIS